MAIKSKEEVMKKLIMILPLALILCFMFGCQDKEAMAELEKFRAQAKVENENMELIRHFGEELDNGNIENLKDFLAPNFLWYEPSNSPTPWSKEEALEHSKMFYEEIPNWQHKIEEIIASGDKVIIRTSDQFINDREFRGIPATGRTIKSAVIVIFTIDNGKIIEMREQMDKLGIMMQMGLELKPKEEK
jgi:predicted ester cyclase